MGVWLKSGEATSSISSSREQVNSTSSVPSSLRFDKEIFFSVPLQLMNVLTTLRGLFPGRAKVVGQSRCDVVKYKEPCLRCSLEYCTGSISRTHAFAR